ncbi:MAG TPA: hypothetical protein VMU54_15760 [Planctomycetota bacterium]|nr:hypothetical protein [Planctomycetota bacterium]
MNIAKRLLLVLGSFVFLVACLGPDAWAQSSLQGTPADSFLQTTKATAKTGWNMLTTLGTVVVGGGSLVSLSMGMYKGNWGQAAISIVAGAAGLFFLWGAGQAFGF